ncbi:MAG: hypothetical protein COY66_04995 [Candidatus Kerfeldbacteria bacterium CG_4_10_14_0_8_um_filter_42_10]|uniref:Uncharacterized protein n=1 Tax=Candidatus Kerfeldbacteria bacterium CG_4_10_14_0_8_um_filter_42_10 TaxID=2014248 RepID=A0A2M7RHP1_9BACT|nr:MAG: hypothetical protein COY66_04995 [Candidatus Kerfeldbacteria bacterium CG_4_10_14_0_8_um_filter_42_10]
MATFIWYLQGTSPTTIDATDYVQFAGGTFGSAIIVGAYQDSTHVESSVGADDSSGNTPKNNKFISQSGGTGGDSQVDLGAGTVDLDTITDAGCALKINFSHGTSVVTTGHIFYAYDGTTTTAVPTGVTFQAAEKGDPNWTNAEGSAAALTITDEATGTSHDYYIAVSASPESVGLKTAFKLRDELTYS